MRIVGSNESFALERGSSIVCVPVGEADAQTLLSLRRIIEHTASTPVVVAGALRLLEQIDEQLFVDTLHGTMWGLALEFSTQLGTINAAIQASFSGDVVMVLPGMHVTAGWLERLRAAALSETTVASATPLCLGYGAVNVLGGEESLEASHSSSDDDGFASAAKDLRGVSSSIDERARRVAERSLRLYPKIAMMGPGCVYIRRAALDLVGSLDESLALVDGLADLAMRLSALGMVHVLADDVLVEGDFVRQAVAPFSAFDSKIDDSIRETISNDELGALRRALHWTRTTLRGLSVTIDGRALTSTAGGTQTYILELILALANEREVTVRVLVPPDLSKRAAETLAGVPEVELLTYEQAIDHPHLTDVVHRPQQVFTPDDLALLRLVGDRVVVGQQDLIAYHNRSYHGDIDTWRMYRRTTRLALAGADQTIFFSEHARRDALAEDLLSRKRTHVVGVGAEAPGSRKFEESRPEGVEADDSFLLCLGADYAHKNRPFAIRLLEALREQGWAGRLVFAGAHVPHGSSRERERELLTGRPDLAPFIVDLGPVDESSRNWLYAHAQALIYPTVYEGFGLLPIEAARAGLPCLFASQASLAEVAGGAATLIPWDAAASASAVLPLLSDGPARDSHLAELHSLSTPSWREVAHQLVSVYEEALSAPPPEAAPRIWQELERESFISRLEDMAREYQDAYHALEARVSTGLPLIDEGGLLSPDQQRGLMRIAARGKLGSLAVAPLGILGRGGGSKM